MGTMGTMTTQSPLTGAAALETARRLGQESRAAEDGGDLMMALGLNEQAQALFLAAGDAPGLLIAFRSRAFILLRLERLDEACAQLARALTLALQMEAEFAWESAGQIVGAASYLAREHPRQLLALGASLDDALTQLRTTRGDFPLEMRGPVEIAAALSSIYSIMGLLAAHTSGEEPLPAAAVERLRTDGLTQAWALDALSRQTWGVTPWLKAWLQARGLPADE